MKDVVYDDSCIFTELVRVYKTRESEDKSMYALVPGVSKFVSDFIRSRGGNGSDIRAKIPGTDAVVSEDGFSRIVKLRRALSALDRSGWDRSYHQRIFHVRKPNTVIATNSCIVCIAVSGTGCIIY